MLKNQNHYYYYYYPYHQVFLSNVISSASSCHGIGEDELVSKIKICFEKKDGVLGCLEYFDCGSGRG